MTLRLELALLPLLCLGGCTRAPDAYPPPRQYVTPPGPDPRILSAILEMGDSRADAHIVQDVGSFQAGDQSRWTNGHPKFTFNLDGAEDWEFVVKFAISDVTLRDTGPVTLTIHIGDQVLDRPRFTTYGDHEYRRLVPASMLQADQPFAVTIDVDPVWIAQTDQNKLGVLLRSVGFEKQN